MSKEASASRLTSKDSQLERNENEFEALSNPLQFTRLRTPLNSITDPCQIQESEVAKSNRISERKVIEASDKTANVASTHSTTRVSARHGKVHSEPSSAQSTPARSSSRLSLGGRGMCPSSLSRVSRGTSVLKSDYSVEVPQFEFVEDPLFWEDHNVQVLIRIRPLSNMERVSQGYARCLRQESSQTLVWLGHPETRFTFDHIASETISQDELFKVAGLPMVENCISGYNSCMFAYGQTGSGKTYTMMGEINEVDGELNEHCGITPRMFEYLFSRIRKEEESRRDERLKFTCKCSFLEIYNEQITDLLEPSSTNLQLREDIKKGVYVENLTEYNVTSVNDIVQLLLQGAANRKIAATYMNSESSRSHSVFTCIIESCWEKDSMTHFRFGRLNLVDLAGSERQKCSGAEGDRLKEAANINKSLSTLGMVIMSLVDLAHGKHRHVPYRDSRLTFLLQDSLGGNSKTMIIANVSPSACSSNETLSTLKFAQRAKLIQNNAKVNEDASGDVTALQRQIQQLKDQLSSVLKIHNISRSPSQRFEESGPCNNFKKCTGEGTVDNNVESDQNKKIKGMEAMVMGAMRREKMAETALQRLEAEIQLMNRLACHREEDAQRSKMILKFREEKIKQLDLLVKGSISAEEYLVQENMALKEEIQLLKAKLDRNPESTCFALKNIRLLEQLRVFQNFYEQGERETLLTEVAELRDQLLDVIEEKDGSSKRYDNHGNDTAKELENCRTMNLKLIREVGKLQMELGKYMNHEQGTFNSVTDSSSKNTEEYIHTEKHSWVETLSIRSDSGDDVSSFAQADSLIPQDKDQKMSNPNDPQKELMDARLLIEALETEQIQLLKELEFMQKQNRRYMDILNNKRNIKTRAVLKLGSYHQSSESGEAEKHDKVLLKEASKNIDAYSNARLEELSKELEVARSLNSRYQEYQASQVSRQHQVDMVCEQVEMETTETILHLQEEVTALQLELDERVCSMAQENTSLRKNIAAKEDEIRVLSTEWERAILELTNFLIDGSRSLQDVSSLIESISCSLPQVSVAINENVERATRICIEKDETILSLQKSLEDAQKMVMEMEDKLISLKGATIAFNECHQPNNVKSTKEATQLSLLNEEIDIVRALESKLKYKEDQITIAEKRAEVAFIVLNWLSDFNMVFPRDGTDWNIPISKPAKIFDMKAQTDTVPTGDAENYTNLSALGIPESDNSVSTYCDDKGQNFSVLETSMFKESSAHLRMVQELVKEIQEMRHNFISFKENSKDHQFFKYDRQAMNVNEYLECKDQSYILWQIKDELALTNGRLSAIEACINDKCVHAFPTNDEDLTEADGWSADYCTSSSDCSTDTVASGNSYNVSSSTYCTKFGSETAEAVDLKLQGGATLEETKKSEMKLKISVLEDATTLSLRKELEMASDAFSKLYSRLTGILDENHFGGFVSAKGEKQEIPYLGSTGDIDEIDSRRPNKVIASKKVDHVSSFLNKFEEARATMKEADVMLNALLKTNEKATQLNVMWEQASEKLVTEKRNLSEEVEQLKFSIGVKKGENEALMDLIRHSMSEIVRSICLLEGCFVELKKEVEDKFNELYSDVLLIRREMQNFISNSRSSIEENFFEILADRFALYILYLCHIRKFLPTNSVPSLESGVSSLKQQQMKSNNCLQKLSSGSQDNLTTYNKAEKEQDSAELVSNVEEREPCSHNNLLYENLSLKRELERKEVLLQGLLFDFRLLQESASSNKDIKDETEQLFMNLNQVRHELEMKTSQLDDLFLQHRKLESSLADSEIALLLSNSNLQLAQERVDTLSDQNAELRVLLKDIYLKKSEADEELEEKREMVNGLEKEILHLASMEKELLSSVDSMEEDLRRVSKEREELREEIKRIEEDMKKMTSERDKLQKEVYILNDKLEMAYALAEEHEAIATEARQESEASNTYANQKEEEVRILEHSVEELERTVNVLEKKVYEMDEEVERHRVIRDSLELELQALRHRLLTVGNFSDIGGSDNNNENNEAQTTRELCDRLLQLQEAHARIKVLEREREEQNKEIKQYRDYISELELHSEAQASQYQLKYKTLETMIRETRTDLSNKTSTAPALEKNEKATMRTRGSSSPFRCIASLVQQMNSEKDQELSIARQRIEELEALAASRQKEVCVLNTRLAAAESMTHDVIRDLLGVKLDMTNYANLIEQHDVQKLVLEAHRQTEESLEKEQVILDLKKQISDLIEERESCITDINKKDTDIMAAQITVEQLQEQHQLLQAQNEMLKMEKNNLKRRITELDNMVKALLSTSSSQQQSIQTSNVKETGSRRKMGDSDFTRRLAHSERILSRVNNELAQYRSSGGSGIRDKTSSVHGYGTRQREQ